MAIDGTTAAELLQRVALYCELLGENPFKIRAYANASRIVKEMAPEDLATLIRGEGPKIPGIGKGMLADIQELFATDKLELLETLQTQVPEGLLEILRIPGLGPRKVRTLWKELGITHPGELEYACQENHLVTLSGFGPKSQHKILEGLLWRKWIAGWFLRSKMEDAGTLITATLLNDSDALQVEVAGEIRRSMEIVRGITMVASMENPQKSLPPLAAKFPDATLDKNIIRLQLKDSIPAEIHAVTPDLFPLALWRLTGSKEHCRNVTAHAADRGWDIGETALRRNGEVIKPASEEELYNILDLPWIPPALREADEHGPSVLPQEIPRLLRIDDLEGLLHVHTKWSDGAETLETMVGAAAEMGCSYIGITDHSQSAFYANGLTPDRLMRQAEEIEKLRKRYPKIEIWHGTESDILSDGSLDFPDEVLKSLDFVIGSIHSQLHMDSEVMTRRLINAVNNPYMDILGHPTGRLLLARETSTPDMEAILKAAAETGTIIEFNANPYRQDLDWRWIPKARQLGVLISVNPDAHNVSGLTHIDYGINTSIKGRLGPEGTFNALKPEEARKRLKRYRMKVAH
ncbi:MAG: DNA polymerase/3'-5' exonuclease PolX [Candidatus Eisenbacteria bacterium]|uniref:DNA polymerase/3'-5' exonuclease PolX n=1 Tax=Eiseniibacteriota bacterium TaxID=2212470 RepID=A0A948S1J2_UNCEI|nr:DNA polymerase/3'-5' exonuclease PolX [Candidatus Eisenbacteria bacterium]MBU1948419.1 DNA polymerase/3'-5' exonuclease PolX [Candidatus Eisenbacteria bacterium]MBU2692134.1 DNA polymerase/3'-5' exonuclease PolX [Candidatus Eisenbacteria bacterium]